MSDDAVRAAGGIVGRRGDDGTWQVLLVHRPRYDDWSFPKGKADGDEIDEDTALREVEEETGLRCELDRPLGETRYRDSKGRPKVVRYWLMQAAGRSRPFTRNDEIDELRWCDRRQAGKLLTYPRDRALLARVPESAEGP